MTNVISIRDQSCPNPQCRSFGLGKSAYVGIHSRKEQRLKCKLCKKTWVIYRHEWRYGLKSDLAKVERVQRLVQAGLSVRKVARELEISPSTVQRWKCKFLTL